MRRVAFAIVIVCLLAIGGGVAVATLPSRDERSRVFEAMTSKSLLETNEGVSWNVVEDSTTAAYPPLAKPSRANRRFAAAATMPLDKVPQIESEIAAKIAEVIRKAGAETTGSRGHSSGEAKVTELGESRMRLRLERRFYRVDGTHGVIETSLIANDENVVLIVSVTE